MNRLKKIVSITIILVLSLNINGQEKTLLSKKEKISLLFDQSGFDKLYTSLFESHKLQFPNITKSTWIDILGTSSETLSLIRPEVEQIYSENLTEEDVNFILDFYNSPVSKKLRSVSEKVEKDFEKRVNTLAENKINDYFTLIEKQLSKTKQLGNCSKITLGNYLYISPEGDTIKITRTEDKQIENLPIGQSEYSIKWTDDCSYTLTCIKYVDEDYKYMEGMTTDVQIISIEPNKIKFIATNDKLNYIDVSYLYKVED